MALRVTQLVESAFGRNFTWVMEDEYKYEQL